MTDWDDLPPDPFETIHPHTLAHFELVPDADSYGIRMKVLIRCLDCDSEVIGEAGCAHEAVRVMTEHAETMNS